MLSLLLCVAAAAAAPATYDQRQDGDYNVRADVQNVVLLVALPQKVPLNLNSLSLLDGLGLFKNAKPETEIQQRSDFRVMEAFVEPPTPYRVEIGESTRILPDGDGGVEVVIAGRRAAGVEAEPADELKLLGATEQCGPGRVRDAETLTCIDQPESLKSDAPLEVDEKTDAEQKYEVVKS